MVAIIGVFSLFASIGFVWMLMFPVHQTIVSALVTVAIYGGFAVGYAALSIARKFWLIPVWALLQAATFTLIANSPKQRPWRFAGGCQRGILEVATDCEKEPGVKCNRRERLRSLAGEWRK